MSEVIKATITANIQKLEQMIQKASLKSGSGDAVHSEVYVNIGGGEARFLASRQNNSVISYSTFGEGYLDNVEIEDDNLTDDNNGCAEAIINVEDYVKWLGHARGDVVEITFRGEENDRLASVMQFHGKIKTRVMLPASESTLEEVPLDAVGRFDDDTHSFVKGDGEPMGTSIEVDTREIRDIIDVVEDDDDTKFYPITVRDITKDEDYTGDEDEDLRLFLNVGRDERRNAAWGALNAKEIKGGEVSNQYRQGFKELFETVSGPVTIETDPDLPICVVQDAYEGQVLRNVIGPVNA